MFRKILVKETDFDFDSSSKSTSMKYLKKKTVDNIRHILPYDKSILIFTNF